MAGGVDIGTACTVPAPPEFVTSFTPMLDVRTLNLYHISDEIRDFACEFDGDFPVDVTVRARVLDFKTLDTNSSQ